MMTSAFFSTLSFKAEQNCDQNSGAKRREDSNSLIMIISCYFCRAIPGVICKSWAANLSVVGRQDSGQGAKWAPASCIERLYGKLSGHWGVGPAGRFAVA